MKDKLIREILKSGTQFPENKLKHLTVESLKMILILRKEYAS